MLNVHAKFHQAKCSGSCVIMLTEKKLSNDAENNTASDFAMVHSTKDTKCCTVHHSLWNYLK